MDGTGVFNACDFRTVLTGAVVTDQVRYTGEWDRCLMPVIDAVVTDQVRYTGEWDKGGRFL